MQLELQTHCHPKFSPDRLILMMPTSTQPSTTQTPTTITSTSTSIQPTTYQRTKGNKKKAIPWDRDGINGGDPSITILLNWLKTGNNYRRWRGHVGKGLKQTKERLCAEIILLMEAQGIKHRDKKGIRQKIGDLQNSYCTACEWKRETGTNILEQDELNGVKRVNEYVRILCRYWDILDPFMDFIIQPHRTDRNLSETQPNLVNRSQQDAGEARPREDRNGDESIIIPEDSHKDKRRRGQSKSSPELESLSNKKKRKKKKSIETFFMKSMISKMIAETYRAQAIVCKAKVSFMAELRQQGYDRNQIALLTEKEFPPIKDNTTTSNYEESEDDDSSSDDEDEDDSEDHDSSEDDDDHNTSE